MPEALEIDPTSEDATNVPLVLSTANNYYLIDHAYPPPEDEDVWVSNSDSEGEGLGNRRPKNRTITLNVDVTAGTDAALRTALRNLHLKIGKIKREGGTLKRTLPSGDVIVFDLLGASADPTFDISFTIGKNTNHTIVFTAKPYGRGASVTLSDHPETTLPCLTFTETGIKGDVPGLGRLVVDEDQAVDQQFVMWGVQSRYYSSATTAALFYQAEALTPLSTSAIAAGSATPSGAGSNVMRNSALIPSYQAVMSTQMLAAANLSHIGGFRVWARVYRPTTNTGAVSVRLSWSEGDFRRFAPNDAVAYATDEREGVWCLADLGVVNLSKAVQGTQQWQGRIEALSTVVNDVIDIDCLFIVPIDEAYGEVRVVLPYDSPSTFLARDEFNQTAGSLNGKTLPVGGTWATSGSSGTDYQVGSGVLTHTSNGTKYGIAGATSYTNLTVKVHGQITGASSVPGLPVFGVISRWVDSSNYVVAYYGISSSSQPLALVKVVAGTQTVLYRPTGFPNAAADTTYELRLTITAAGVWRLWLAGALLASGQDAVFATGGALATGKPGIYHSMASTGTTTYDGFAAWAPTADAAMFASQSIEWRHNTVIREDSAGAIWVQPSKPNSDYLFIPPAGPEARTLRGFVKGSRGDPDFGADAGIDDLSARLTYTPRYLEIPDQ